MVNLWDRQVLSSQTDTYIEKRFKLKELISASSLWLYGKEQYNEHKYGFRNISHSSKFAHHLIEHVHSFGSINDIMQVLHYHKKGTHLNTIERFLMCVGPRIILITEE